MTQPSDRDAADARITPPAPGSQAQPAHALGARRERRRSARSDRYRNDQDRRAQQGRDLAPWADAPAVETAGSPEPLTERDAQRLREHLRSGWIAQQPTRRNRSRRHGFAGWIGFGCTPI